MKQKLSMSLRSILALSLVLVSPGIAAAQVVGAAAESAAGVSAASAPSAVSGPMRLDAIAAPLAPAFASPITALSLHAAPAAENPAAPGAVNAAAAPAAAPAAAAPEGAPQAAPAAVDEAAAAPAAAAAAPADEDEGETAEAPLRADPALRIGAALSDDGGSKDAPGTARPASASRLGRLFDGWRSRGDAVDANAPVAEAGETGSLPSGLKPASASSAAPQPGVPSPRAQKAARLIGAAVSLGMMAHWIAPRLAAVHAAPIAAWLATVHPFAALGAAAIGGVAAVVSARRAGAGVMRSAGSAVGGALTAAASAHVAFDFVQMALNGFSTVGVSPVITGVAAIVLARTAFKALSNPGLTRGERVRAVAPAVAASLLLAAQTVLVLSIHSVPQLAAASALAAVAGTLLIQALAVRGDARAAKRTSRGLTLTTLALFGALFFLAPATAWWFAAAAGAGLAISLAGLISAVRLARAAAARRAAFAPAPAASVPAAVVPEAVDPAREGIAPLAGEQP